MKYININGKNVKLTKTKIKEIIKLKKPYTTFKKYDNDPLVPAIYYTINNTRLSSEETLTDRVDDVYDGFEEYYEEYINTHKAKVSPEKLSAGGHLAVAAAVKDIAPGSVDAIDQRIAKKINPKEKERIVYYEKGGEIPSKKGYFKGALSFLNW